MRHEAIRDCAAGKATLTLLGLVAQPSERHLSIQTLCEIITEAACPFLTRHGRKLLATDIDPFSACWIAPDHVLTGHLDDCLNLAFKLLPNRQVRRTVESMCLQILRDCDLQVQNRILSSTTMRLLKMSMSDLYAVGLVAPLAFRLGVDLAKTQSSQSFTLTCTFEKSLRLVQSVSDLIPSLFWAPSPTKDTVAEVSAFFDCSSTRHVAKLRTKMESHLSLVRDICSPTRALILELNASSTSRTRRRDLQSLIDGCTAAIAEVDKPNVHRLFELTGTTLHMLTKLSLVGELLLERRHQVLKRAARRANNINIHEHAMSTVIFNDWQSRLTANLFAAQSGDKQSQVACFRLLQGRDAIWQCAGHPSPSDLKDVMETLKSSSPLPQELATQSLSIVSDSSQPFTVLSSFRCSKQDEFSPDGQHVSILTDALHASHPGARRPFVWRKAIRFTGRPSRSLSFVGRNSILSTLSPHVSSTAEHFPFVQLSSRTRVGTHFRFWAVCDIVSIDTGVGSWIHYARVLPVLQKTDSSPALFAANTLRNECLLLLTSEAQSAACLHDCKSASCTVLSGSLGVRHCPVMDPLNGTPFYLLRRSDGYPSRVG